MPRLNHTSAYSEIVLTEGKRIPDAVQVLRVGTFNHPKYGRFEITPLVLAELKQNFDNNVRGIDISFDYFHDSDKEASAWVKRLELRENNTQLWAIVDWTPAAAQKLAERELRYFSPDFAFKWQDPETGSTFNNVLFGGGLTNRPFVKEMQAIVADELQGEKMTELEKLQAKLKEVEAANLKLNEDNKAMQAKMALPPVAPAPAPTEESDEVKALKDQIAQLQAQLDKAMKDQEMAMAEKKKLEESVKYAEQEKAFNILLTEGKACAAQKDAFIKNDMVEFIKLAQPVNLKPGGTGHSPDPAAEDKEDKILKLAETKCKEDKTLSFDEAVSIAKKELK